MGCVWKVGTPSRLIADRLTVAHTQGVSRSFRVKVQTPGAGSHRITAEARIKYLFNTHCQIFRPIVASGRLRPSAGRTAPFPQ